MDSVEMSWGMAKATNPSDAVTGHRPLQMISQIFVDMSHSKYMFNMNSLFITALFHQLVGQFVFETPCNFTSLQPSPSILVLMLVAFCRSSARKSKFGSGRSPTWRSMRHAFGWQLMDIHCHFVCRSRANDHFCPICVFSLAMHLNERKLSHYH